MSSELEQAGIAASCHNRDEVLVFGQELLFTGADQLPRTTCATHCLPVSLQRLKTIKGCLNVDTNVQLQRICEVYTKQHLLTVRLTPYPQIVIELSPNEGNCCIARRRTAVVGRLPPRLKKKSDTSRPQRFLISKKEVMGGMKVQPSAAPRSSTPGPSEFPSAPPTFRNDQAAIQRAMG